MKYTINASYSFPYVVKYFTKVIHIGLKKNMNSIIFFGVVFIKSLQFS